MYGHSAFDAIDADYFDDRQTSPRARDDQLGGRSPSSPGAKGKARQIQVTRVHRSGTSRSDGGHQASRATNGDASARERGARGGQHSESWGRSRDDYDDVKGRPRSKQVVRDRYEYDVDDMGPFADNDNDYDDRVYSRRVTTSTNRQTDGYHQRQPQQHDQRRRVSPSRRGEGSSRSSSHQYSRVVTNGPSPRTGGRRSADNHERTTAWSDDNTNGRRRSDQVTSRQHHRDERPVQRRQSLQNDRYRRSPTTYDGYDDDDYLELVDDTTDGGVNVRVTHDSDTTSGYSRNASARGQVRSSAGSGAARSGGGYQEERWESRGAGRKTIPVSRPDRSSRDGSRSSSTREVSDHLEEIESLERGPRLRELPGGKKFFEKVVTELDEQREFWKDEVERLAEMSLVGKLPKAAQAQGTNSFVDTSSGRPVFTALVDVSEFHPKSVQVDYEHLTNRVVVKGQSHDGIGTMTKTFTQKVQLPRYSDDQKLTSRLSNRGILRVEVPLMYYFPEQQHKGRAVKSFVNEVKTHRDGSQTLEILVNTGPGVTAKDLHVQVTEDRILLVSADKEDSASRGRPVRKLIKKYHLSERADVDRITSKMGRDGRLVVLVPLLGKQSVGGRN